MESAARGSDAPPLWAAMLLTAMAGGMGWGIRGQYGHETGAMIPGLLVGLVITLLFCRRATSLEAARVVALVAIGFSFGGSQTYGQTLGLTQNPEVRDISHYWWGMLGCSIKGGIWIGLGGAFLGIGLGDRRYRALEVVILMFALLGLFFAGLQLLNRPFDPPDLPRIYFSDDWGIGGPDWKPRHELWGGLLFALAGLVIYTAVIKKDRLARNLALFGFLAGGLGFPLGQSIQAHHAWHGSFLGFDENVNWWNMMEITFGLVLGAVLALGVWLHRRHILFPRVEPAAGDGAAELSTAQEWTLAALHAAALATWTFGSYRLFDTIADVALTMGMIPVLGIIGGRLWPYLLSLPLLALPIAGKTVLELAYGNEPEFSRLEGWTYFGAAPLAVMVVAALWFSRYGRRGQRGQAFAAQALVLSTWFYFALNHAVFRFPWLSDAAPATRPLSAAIFLVCSVCLTIAAWVFGRRRPERESLPMPDLGGDARDRAI